MAVTRSVSPETASATGVVPPRHCTMTPPTAVSPSSRATGSPVSSAGVSSGSSCSAISAWTSVTATGVTPSPKSWFANRPRTSIAPAASVTVSAQRAPATMGASTLSPAASTACHD